MYQVTFSPQSAKVFGRWPQAEQLKVVEALSVLSPESLELESEPAAKFKRAETIYYRYRIGDLRFYFTLKETHLFCLFILSKNTWADFRLRNNLEKLSEVEIEKKPDFLEMLEKSE